MLTTMLKAVYPKLPYAVRALGASFNGMRLSRWRFGPETEELANAAVKREAMSVDEWCEWQERRLSETLEIAVAKVPYYREYWAGGNGNWRDLANWPLLRKDEIREDPGAFVRDDVALRRLFHFHTSGSTGTPLNVWISRGNLRAWYALSEARWRGWNGVSRRDTWSVVGGQRIIPFDRRRPPFWVWNPPMRQLYISAYHIADWSVELIVEALKRREVRFIYGYASAVSELARCALRRGLEPPPIRAVLSNAEPLLPDQRRLIKAFFDCSVVDTYGMTEMAAGASECSEGHLHLWPEAAVVEVVDLVSGKPCADGETGALVGTGMINTDMLFIRYVIGDRGALCPVGDPCACGRAMQRLQRLEGRLDDVIIASDGRRIGRLDTAFKSDLPIEKAQIVQQALGELEIRVVPGAGYGEAAKAKIAELLRQRVGDLDITVSEVAELPLGPNGKFRGVVSTVARSETQEGI